MDIVKKIMRNRARYYYVYVSHTEGIFYGQFFRGNRRGAEILH